MLFFLYWLFYSQVCREKKKKDCQQPLLLLYVAAVVCCQRSCYPKHDTPQLLAKACWPHTVPTCHFSTPSSWSDSDMITLSLEAPQKQNIKVYFHDRSWAPASNKDRAEPGREAETGGSSVPPPPGLWFMVEHHEKKSTCHALLKKECSSVPSVCHHLDLYDGLLRYYRSDCR